MNWFALDISLNNREPHLPAAGFLLALANFYRKKRIGTSFSGPRLCWRLISEVNVASCEYDVFDWQFQCKKNGPSTFLFLLLSRITQP
jgi:hypothetical protein